MKNKRLVIMKIGIVALSAVFIFTGAARGECGEVLKKAIQVCLACIGIG